MNLRVIFYLFIFSLSFEGFGYPTKYIHLSATNILLLILLLVTTIKVFKNDLDFILSPEAKIFWSLSLLIFLADLYSLFFSEFPLLSVRSIVTRVGSLITLFLTSLFVTRKEHVKKTIKFLSLGVILLSIMTLSHSLGILDFGKPFAPTRHFAGYEIPFRRTIGAPIDYGSYGMITIPVLTLLLIFSLKGRDLFRTRFLAFSSFLIVGLGIFISQSRSTWLAAIFSISTASALLFFKKTKILFFLIIMILVFLIPVIYFYVGLNYEEGKASWIINIGPSGEANVYNRLESFHLAIEILKEHPFGISHNVFREMSGGDRVLHNNFLYQLTATGIIGFLPYLLFFFFLLVVYYNMIIKAGMEIDLVIIGLFAAIIGMLVELQFFQGFSDKILWVVTGLINGLSLTRIGALIQKG